jgi:signal transduction histidine kinase
MAPLTFLINKRFEHQILALMLASLHLALWWDFGGALSRSLILAHLGLFLMWQPLWRREQRLNWQGSIVFIIATLAFIIWMDWGLMTFWLLILTAIVGGRVTARRGSRYAYLMALMFLVSEILIACVPSLIALQFARNEAWGMLGYGLFIVPVVLFFVPDPKEPLDPEKSVDFLYGLTVSLLTCILAMGSLLSMYITGAQYPVAVIQTILAIALFLLAISWLWTPLGGFSGLGQLWERYLQNIGTPFEVWLGRLADLALGKQTPGAFLESAIAQLAELPWVTGATWSSLESQGETGKTTPSSFDFVDDDLKITVYAQRRLGAALRLHGQLLLQLVAHFFRAKQREEELTRTARLQAVYETGARITHDIKNLLQSLQTTTAAMQSGKAGDEAELRELVARQLPHVNQRLQLALDKLQAPEKVAMVEGSLSEWWDSLQARNMDAGIEFESELGSDPMVPLDLFDSVAENLLENARSKRLSEPHIQINVHLEAHNGVAHLCVSDDGSSIDTDTAQRLFKSPVSSRNGLGIGLYQAARLAHQWGYQLTLTANRPKHVAFDLKRD